MSRSGVSVLQKHTRIGDPHVTSDDSARLSILRAVVEPLVRREPGGTYRPCLATRWELSDDAKSWTFHLRDGVVCHDGTSLAAEDVVSSLTRIRDEDVGGELGTQGVYRSYLEGSQITADRPERVTLSTPEPAADLLDLLVDIPILPKHTLEGLPSTIVGTGPYRFTERSDTRVLMTRYPRYWAETDRPETVEWLAVSDARERLELLLRGEADLVVPVPPEEVAGIDARDDLRVVTVQTSVCATFMCNLLDGPCTRVEVRQALNYALDVPELIRSVVGGAAKPLTGPLTSLHLGFDPGTEGYPYDPDRARALLERAGVGPSLDLTLDVPTTLPDEAPELARKMVESYAQVGLEVNVVAYEDRPAYAEMVRAKELHDAACFDSSPLSTFRVLREKFHSGLRGPWWLGYHNPEVDGLIDEARATPATELRQALYRQAYGLISRDAPWIFLYNPLRYIGVKENLGGWHTTPEGLIGFA